MVSFDCVVNRLLIMRKILLPLYTFITFFIQAQHVKSPSEFHGFALGEQFTRHHEMVGYFKYLAEVRASEVKWIEYGQSYERRPLHLAILSSKENLKNLDAIQQAHLEAAKGGNKATKAIVWLSYNVHGNESSGTEAAMKTVHALLTSHNQYLRNTVVIIDPCVNPDGRERYVNWYYQNKNSPFHTDANSIEHHEGWRTGRSNHYMFDLNRDWAWLTQVESEQRLAHYNKWLPHIHVDFHEQGINKPYYFPPAAEPYHEVVTLFQRNFQKTVGENHVKYFDSRGWLHNSKEVFDLFYPSYGDTYPTFNGSVGMTYEQGGSGQAGLAIHTQKGDTLTLTDRIEHHYITGLSTLEVAAEHVVALNTAFKNFFNKRDFTYKSYVLSGNKDNIDALKTLLDKHEIAYGIPKDKSVKGYRFSTGSEGVETIGKNAMVVSTNQSKGTLVKVLFEPNANLADSLTYDSTAWSLPFAYGLNTVATTTVIPSENDHGSQSLKALDDAFAYITDWNSRKDAHFLTTLFQKKIHVRAAYTPIVFDGVTYPRGSLIIIKSDNHHKKDFLNILNRIVQEHHKTITPITGPSVDVEKDFNAPSVHPLTPPKVAVLTGKPVSPFGFGEIWYFFEQQLHYPITVIATDYADILPLEEYDILILPEGNYTGYLNPRRLGKLNEWVAQGGKLVAIGDALNSLQGKNGFGIATKQLPKDSLPLAISPKNRQREFIKNTISGAIFKAKVDSSQPLAFGYGNSYFTLKMDNRAFNHLKEGNAVYLAGNQNAVSGFAGSKARKRIADTLVFGTENHGKGQVVYLVDNPLFRGFWENGKLFFANAIFMTNVAF